MSTEIKSNEGSKTTTHKQSKGQSKLSFRDQLMIYSMAATPFLWVTTHEEKRVTNAIYDATKDDKDRKVLEWDGLNGLRFKGKDGKYNSIQDTSIKDVIEKIRNMPESPRLFVMKDFHHWIESPGIIRGLRNIIHILKAKGSTLIFVSPLVKIPTELSKDITLLEYNLPDENEIAEGIEFIRASVKQMSGQDLELSDDVKTNLIISAKGLTANEAENAITIALVKHKEFNAAVVKEVFEEKVRQVQYSSNLTHVETGISFDQVGGMIGLKDWLKTRALAFSSEAKEYGLPKPRGILLAGVPGTGKSLIAKAIAQELGVPMFQADVGALFGKYVGETESNFRNMLSTVDSIGRCVLFIDEIEKGLSRQAVSGSGDTGTSSRAFGTLLTWLSDHTSEVFVVGTSNDFTILPPALIRKGRFDEVFWLDLPSATEREEVCAVQLKKYKRSPKEFDLKALAAATKGFSGSEIEQLIVATMYRCFPNNKDIDTEELVLEAKHIIPHSVTNQDALHDMRDQAKGKLRSVQEMGVVGSTTKKVAI